MNYLFLITTGTALIALSGLLSLYFKRRDNKNHPLNYLYSIDPSVSADPDYFRKIGMYQATKKTAGNPAASVRYDWSRLV